MDNMPVLDKGTLQSELKRLNDLCIKAVVDCGPRYTEAAHVDLEIANLFSGLCHTDEFKNELLSLKGRIRRSYVRVNDPNYFGGSQDLVDQLFAVTQALHETIISIDQFPTDFDADSSSSNLPKMAKDTAILVGDLHNRLYSYEPEESPKSSVSGFRSRKEEYIYHYREFAKTIDDLEVFCQSAVFSAHQNPTLWISSAAGFGKTHLLCDAINKRIDKGQLSIFLLGQQLSDADIWGQLCQKLNLIYSGDAKSEFLRKTRAWANHAGSKLLIVIDAINEGPGISFWPNKINEFRDEIRKHSHLSIAVSCRSTYEHLIAANPGWLKVQHIGFEQHLYQATKRYFKYYGITSHEIPLVGEFKNPLFLKTYCEALQGEKLTSATRGHKGIKWIHEKYFHKIDSRLAERLRYPLSKKPCHAIAKEIASDMATNGREWISVEKYSEITKQAAQKLEISSALASEMLNEGLLTRDFFFDFTSKMQHEGVRFSFQKFSDIFVAREILIQNGLNKNNITRKFAKIKAIKRVFSEPYRNKALIEALSTLVPEWSKGKSEVFLLVRGMAPENILRECFVDSLMWRELSAFPQGKRLISVLRAVTGGKSQNYHNLLLAILSVCTTPNHPLNADFLNEHLKKMKMPIRDAQWSTFLHYNYDDDGVIPRIINWAWDLELSQISHESLRLFSLSVSWLFTSSNRFIRDRATKALVLVLVSKPDLALYLLETFEKCDDEYVHERIVMAIYAASARAVDRKPYSPAANYLYSNYFARDRIPENVVIRHYMRAFIAQLNEDFPLKEFNSEKILPPFKSKWPKKTVPMSVLEKRYELIPHEVPTPKRGAYDIFHSVMHDDFGVYVIGSRYNKKALSNWRKKEKESAEDLSSSLRKNLKSRAAKKAFDMLLQAYESPIAKEEPYRRMKIKVITMLEISLQHNLTGKQFDIWTRIKKLLKRRHSKNGTFLLVEQMQRMVIQGTEDLGYDSKLHGDFDRFLGAGNYARSPNKPERIGKKYQWISYFRLMGLVTDHFDYVDYGSEVRPEPTLSDMHVDQIDPTITVRSKDDLLKLDAALNISYPQYDDWSLELDGESWLKRQDDLLDVKALIERRDSNGKNWLLLDGGCSFTQPLAPDQDSNETIKRRIFYVINAYIYKKKDESKVIAFLNKQNFIGRWMPENREQISPHLAEFYNKRMREKEFVENLWRKKDRQIPFQMLLPVENYLYESGTFDCSMDESISLALPAFSIASDLKIGFGGFDGVYIAAPNDSPVAFNISSGKGSYGLMFEKDALSKYLSDNNFGIFWAILSEKDLLGGLRYDSVPGRLDFSTGFNLENENLTEYGRKIEFRKFEKTKPQAVEKET